MVDVAMRCFACRQAAVAQCPRCGRWFCLQHGGRQCDRCRAPESLLPSALLFRGAVVLFVLSLGLTGWFLVAWPVLPEPPSSAAQNASTPVTENDLFPASTPQSESSASPSPLPTETPGATAIASPVPTQVPPTPAPPATPTPAPTASATGGVRRYVVQPGDTLNSIAAQFGSSVRAIIDVNNIADPESIRVGLELIIP